MNNSLKKRLLSVVMAAVMAFSMLPTTAWAAMVENRSAAGQTRTEQKKDGSDAYAVTQDAENGVAVRAAAAVRAGVVRKVICLDTTTMKEVTHQLDSDGGWHWVPAPANCLTLKNVQIVASGGNALILPDGATVVVEGDCVIEGGADSAVWSKGKVSVELEQDASLTVNGLGWYAQGNMTVTRAYDAYTGGELIVNFKGNKSGGITRGAAINMGSNTLYVEKGMKVTADGGNAVKDGDSCGVKGAVYVDSGAELVAIGGSAGSTGVSRGIFGNVTVSNGTITATGGSGIKSYGFFGDTLSVSNGAELHATGGTAVQNTASSAKPTSGGIYLSSTATINAATVNATGGVAPCGNGFASVGLQMTSGSKLKVERDGVLNATGGKLTTGSSTNEKNGFSAGINMMGARDADLLVSATGSVTAIGDPTRTDGVKVQSYGVNYTDTGDLAITLSDAASFKASGGIAASRVRFWPDTVSIKGSAAYKDFVNVTDGYNKFHNSTYVKNDDLYDLAKSLVVTVCDHSAGFTDGKCSNCGYQCPHTGVDDTGKCSTCGTQMAAKVTASGKDTLYTDINEAMAAAFGHSDATVTLLADAVVTEATFTGNATVVLEMGDYTLGGSFTLENGASLAISKDNGAAGQLTANIKVDTSVLTLIEDASRTATTSVVALYNAATLDCQSTAFGGTVELYSGTVELRCGNTPCTFARIVNKTDAPICLYDIVGTGKAVVNSYNSMLTRAGATLQANSAAVGERTIQTCTHPSGVMTDGVCICGYNCPHDTINNDTGKCEACGKQVRVVKVTQQSAEPAFYATLQEAVDAAANAAAADGCVITLLDDMDLGVDCVEIEAGVFVLDLGGHTLSGERYSDGVLNVLGAGADVTVRNGAIVNTHDGGNGDANGIYVKKGVLMVPQGGSLTVTGGDQSGSFGSGAAIRADGGMLYILSGTFNGRLDVYNTGTSVHLQGGTFTEGVNLYHNITPYSILDTGYTFVKTDDSSVIDLSDASLKSGSVWKLSASVTVAQHTHDFTNGGVCACGMACTHEHYNNEGKCTVCGAEATMMLTQTDGTVTYGSYLNMWAFLQDGANQPVSGTLTLLDNVSFDKKNQHGMLWISGDLTLDLNGKTLSCTAESEQSRTLTLVGSTEGSTLTIIDSKGTGTSTVVLSPAGPMTLVIKSGTFESPYESGYAASVGSTSGGAKLRIEGGTFDSVYGLKSDGGTLELAGGTITESLWSSVRDQGGVVAIDMRELLAEGYIYQLNGASLRRDDAQLNPAKSLRGTITVVQCAHESMTGGVCDYCGASYEATVTSTAGEITSYQTFEDAIAAAADLNGCTVKLLTDVAVEADYTIGAGTFTIDFNGKRLTVDGNSLFVISPAVVTLQDDSAAIQLSQLCVPNAVEGGRIIVNSGAFAGGIVQQPQGTLLLNGGYFGMITLWDENGDVMDLLGAGKTYKSTLAPDSWPNDSNADTTSMPGQKRLHEVEVVGVPLSIIRQVPASGPLTVYETSPVKPDLKVVATYDATMGGNVTAVLYYRTDAIKGWTEMTDAAEVDDIGNGTVTVTSKTELQNGQYQFGLTYRGYRVESRDFTVVLENCTHPDIDNTGKCGTCQHQFVATLTAPDRTVTGYTTLGEALTAVETPSADAQNATKYTVKLHQDVTEDVRITGGKFTLDLNGKTATAANGTTISGATTMVSITKGKLVSDVTISGSAQVTVDGAEGLGTITLQDKANLLFYPGAEASAFKVESAAALVTMNGGAVGAIHMTAGTVNANGASRIAGQVDVNGGEMNVRDGVAFGGDVNIKDGAKMTVALGSTAKFYGLLHFAEAATGELASGTYEKLTCQNGRWVRELLKSGCVYYGISTDQILQGKTDQLTGVKVIQHTHSVGDDGTCACGESFMASVSGGTKTDWYKTLGEALTAVKTLSASAQDATRYTVKVYKDVTEDVNITGGKFTLDLNGKSVGDFDTSDRTAFVVSGSAEVILTGGRTVWYGMQIKDTANLTVNSTRGLSVVELYGSASLTANGVNIPYLKNMEGTPAATVNGGMITYMTIKAGTVELTGNVTVGYEFEVPSGSVLTVRSGAQGKEPVLEDVVTIRKGGKLVASAGEFESEVVFDTGAKGELSGGTYGHIECGSDQLLKDVLMTGYAFFANNQLVNGYVTSLTGRVYTVKGHAIHDYEWDTTTHEKKCGCGDVIETDTAAPVIDFLNGAEINTENGQQVMDVTDNVTYTVTDANLASVTVSYDNGAPEQVIPTAGSRYDLSLNDGDGKLVTITATDDAGNVTTVTFTLYRLVEMRVIDHEGVAVAAADMNRTVRNGQPYTLHVTMQPGYTGAGGLELEQGLLSKRLFTGNDADGYTIQVTADFSNSLLNILNAYDNTHPTAEITIKNSSFKDFLNRIFFDLFFKETQTVNVTAADVGAGLDKVEYLLSGTAFTDKAVVEAATGWTALTLNADGAGSFTLDPNSKSFLYVKATDKGGNVTVINADGMVIYTDAQPITTRINFAKTSTEDSVFYVRDNGNTVKSITMGNRALVKDTDYRVGTSADGQLPITLTNSFLQALTAGSYTLTVSYNPLGETYVSGGDNQTPAATTVALSVGKTTVDATIASMNKIYDSQPVTPSATTESDGAMTWEFKPDGADPSAYTTTAPEDAGTYNVHLTVAETDRYNAISKTATFTITPKDLTLHTPALENKTYDGNTSIVCSYYDSERAMVGKISGDNLSIVMGQANADSADVGYRTVTFTGFGLTGDDAPNYNLTGQPISGSAEITVRTLTIADLTVSDKLYDGLNTAAIEGTPTLVNLVDGETLTLRCGTPAFDTVAVGDNIPVSFTEFTIADTATGKAGNYSLTQPTGITASIRAYVADGAEYTATTGEWTNQDFVVTAADGWQVSTTNTANGDWRDGLTRSDETGTGSLTFYVKNAANGYISEAIALTYKIDKTNPTGELRIDERSAWQSFWNTISFNLFYKSEQTVTLTAADEASGVAATGYLLSEEDYSVAQLEGMTFQPYTAPVAITPDSRLIAYARITDVAGNVTYLRSDGVVLDATAPVITGVDDGTVYCDSVTFTVTDAYLDTVTVDGAAAVSAPTRTVESTYVIEADSQLHTIVATDRAGNSTQVQITVNDGHTVGTPATCKDLAVCKYCGESFGDLAPDNHDGLRRVAKVNATSTTDGNIEYWYCDGCGKYYLDAAATREITREDTILPAVGLRIVDDVKVWSPDDKPLGVIFHPDYDSFTVQIDGVTVDPANYDVTTDPATGKLIVTFRTPFLRTLAFGEHTITILSNDGSASVSFKVDRAYANAPDGKTDGKGESGGKNGKDGVKSAGTGDSFPMGSMVAALFISGGALALMSIRARRKEEEE